ncbi:MAG: hypothetical protein J7K14_00890 [Sulfurimonas sp.]|nr:hypothetical protein [Sulfurimonas sp.]
MIKLLLVLFLVTSIYASDSKKASGIFNLIVKEITKKENSSVYLHKGIESIEKYPGNLKIVTECKDADIIILSTTRDIPKECNKKLLFGSRYSHLKNPNVIGAFFWQKGRPNILFYQKRLNTHHIKLNSSFNRYIEE